MIQLLAASPGSPPEAPPLHASILPDQVPRIRLKFPLICLGIGSILERMYGNAHEKVRRGEGWAGWELLSDNRPDPETQAHP